MENKKFLILCSFSAVFGLLVMFIAYKQYQEMNYAISMVLGITSIAMLLNSFYVFVDKVKSEERYEIDLMDSQKFDLLTSLPSMSYFKNIVGRHVDLDKLEIGDENRYLVNIGIQELKKIEEAEGMTTVEGLYKSMAATLIETLEEEDEVTRVPGSGFLIMTSKKPYELNRYIEQIKENIEGDYGSNEKERNFHISLKAGVSKFNRKEPQDYDEVFSESVLALNAAVKLGQRVLYREFDEGLRKESSDRMRYENLMRGAMEREEIFVNFQPKVDKNGIVRSAEALARWKIEETGEFVRPDIFIEIAEDLDLIDDIGEHIMALSIEQMKIWRKRGYNETKLAVNVSAKQFNTSLPIKIKRLLDEHHVPPRLFEIEITESALVNNKKECIKILNDIKEMGVSIAIDDFGTGYSSLSYLVDLPLDVLKIDKSFVDKIVDEKEDNAAKGHAVISTIMALSKSLGYSVVAEGAEESSQVEYLKNEGVNLIQGYFYSKPLSNCDFIKYLTQHGEQVARKYR